MTPEERQALREKHREIFDDYGSICDYCEGARGYEDEKIEIEKSLPEDEKIEIEKSLPEDEKDDPINFYPCDVIKVLDATEPEVPINWAAGK